MQCRVAFPNFIKIKNNNKTGLKSTKRLGIIFLARSQLKKDHPMEMHFRTRQSQKTSFFSLWYLESLSKLSGGTTTFSASFFLSTLVAAHRMFLFIHGDTCSFVRSFERSTVQVTSFMHTERHTVWATEDHFIKCFFCSFVRSFLLAWWHFYSSSNLFVDNDDDGGSVLLSVTRFLIHIGITWDLKMGRKGWSFHMKNEFQW
jgi:hypothetical protein